MPVVIQYEHRRIQEEVLEEYAFGTVSRNRLGCEVLNVEQVMFIDWDVDARAHLRSKPMGFLARIRRTIFGSNPAELEAATREAKQIRYQQVRDQLKDLSMLSARVYETHSGFRGIITSSLFSPSEEVSQALLIELGSDALYTKLCRIQGTFRARLTPKYWRLGMGQRPFDAGHRADFTPVIGPAWLERYQQISADRAVCRFVAEFGAEATDPIICAVIALHDQRCKAHQMLELA
jgi:hypothetical protein